MTISEHFLLEVNGGEHIEDLTREQAVALIGANPVRTGMSVPSYNELSATYLVQNKI